MLYDRQYLPSIDLHYYRSEHRMLSDSKQQLSVYSGIFATISIIRFAKNLVL